MLAAAICTMSSRRRRSSWREISERFGQVAGVDSLTETQLSATDPGSARFATGSCSGGDAVVIYAADRVANMRDWRRVAPEDRGACGRRLGTTLEERLQLWTEDLEELQSSAPTRSVPREIEEELGALVEPRGVSPAGRRAEARRARKRDPEDEEHRGRWRR